MKHKWVKGFCENSWECLNCGIIKEKIRVNGEVHIWYYGEYLTDSDPGCKAQENHKL
jgi:hypothetical protein